MTKGRPNQTATVRVQVVLEVTLNGRWGHDCSIGQAYEQGTSDAVNHVRNRLENATGVRVLGATATTVVISEGT